MAKQLIFTSAPRGLREGSRGYCTVAATPGLHPALMDRLEALSSYAHPFDPAGPQADANPPAYSYLRIRVAGSAHHVLSRRVPAGFDYTGRSNTLAHHLILEPYELQAANPAGALRSFKHFRARWDEGPAPLPLIDLPVHPSRPSSCRYWQDAMGDAGLAGVALRRLIEQTPAVLSVIHPVDADPLALVDEALALLAGTPQAWAIPFSTMPIGAGLEQTPLRMVRQDLQEPLRRWLKEGALLLPARELVGMEIDPWADAARVGQPIQPLATSSASTSPLLRPTVTDTEPPDPVETALPYELDFGSIEAPSTRGPVLPPPMPPIGRRRPLVAWVFSSFIVLVILAIAPVWLLFTPPQPAPQLPDADRSLPPASPASEPSIVSAPTAEPASDLKPPAQPDPSNTLIEEPTSDSIQDQPHQQGNGQEPTLIDPSPVLNEQISPTPTQATLKRIADLSIQSSRSDREIDWKKVKLIDVGGDESAVLDVSGSGGLGIPRQIAPHPKATDGKAVTLASDEQAYVLPDGTSVQLTEQTPDKQWRIGRTQSETSNADNPYDAMAVLLNSEGNAIVVLVVIDHLPMTRAKIGPPRAGDGKVDVEYKREPRIAAKGVRPTMRGQSDHDRNPLQIDDAGTLTHANATPEFKFTFSLPEIGTKHREVADVQKECLTLVALLEKVDRRTEVLPQLSVEIKKLDENQLDDKLESNGDQAHLKKVKEVAAEWDRIGKFSDDEKPYFRKSVAELPESLIGSGYNLRSLKESVVVNDDPKSKEDDKKVNDEFEDKYKTLKAEVAGKLDAYASLRQSYLDLVKPIQERYSQGWDCLLLDERGVPFHRVRFEFDLDVFPESSEMQGLGMGHDEVKGGSEP